MTPPRQKTIITAGLLIAAIAFIWMGVGRVTSANRLELSGMVQAKEVKNASRFGGRIEKIRVQEGDVVKAGDTLVVFDDIELRSKIAEARAALSQARAQKSLIAKGVDIAQLREARAMWQQAEEHVRQLSTGGLTESTSQIRAKLETAKGNYETAQAQFNNADRLLAEGIISQQKYQQLRSAYEVSKSNLEAAQTALSLSETGSPEQLKIARAQQEAAKARYDQLRRGAKPEEVDIALANVEKAQSVLEALEAQMKELELKAPIAGTVSVISASEGELVPAGRPVISIVDYSNLWVDVFVPETRLEFADDLGKEVEVRAPARKNALFNGRVALLSQKGEFMPTAGGTTSTDQNTFRVKIEVDSHDRNGKARLLPGMKVNVTLRK